MIRWRYARLREPRRLSFVANTFADQSSAYRQQLELTRSRSITSGSL